MSETESRLSKSLAKKITGKQKPEENESDANDSIVVEEGVENTEEQVSGDSLEKDPFDEANEANMVDNEISQEAEVVPIKGQPESDNFYIGDTQIPSDELVDPDKPEKVEKVEKVKPIKKKKNNEKSGGGVVLPGIAIVLSASALGFSVFSGISQDVFQNKMTETVAGIELSVTELFGEKAETSAEMDSLTRLVNANSTGIQEMSDMRGQLLNINESINAVNAKAIEVESIASGNSEKLKDHDKKIDGLTQQIDEISARPVPKVTKAPKPKKTVKNTARANTVAGASVSSIDTWGNKDYVVLRDSEGEWVPLQKGDKYKGWKYTGSNGEQAIFKRPGRTKKLTIEG